MKMNFYSEDIMLSTNKRIEIIDITDEVYAVVKRSGIKNGIC